MTCRLPRKASPDGCRAARTYSRQMSLSEVVCAYLEDYRECAERELADFAAEPTVASAARRAALAEKPDRHRYDHQRRIPSSSLALAARRLGEKDLEGVKDFDSLHDRVQTVIGSIHRIGELAVYDTALRIGARLGLMPERVYLHRGTREGARALGLNWRAASLAITECPVELRALRPNEIEDCLCIFKDHFAKATLS